MKYIFLLQTIVKQIIICLIVWLYGCMYLSKLLKLYTFQVCAFIVKVTSLEFIFKNSALKLHKYVVGKLLP